MKSFQSRVEKVTDVSYDEALKLIYQWVKQKEINLKEFISLIEENRLAIYYTEEE